MTPPRPAGITYILKKSLLSALVALVLFTLMVGIRTEAGSDGQLTYWTRFGEVAALVAAVFGGSIVIELLRQWIGPSGAERLVPPAVQSGMSCVGRYLAPALLIFTFLVPVIFYDQRYILDLAILVLTYVMLGWGLNVVVGLAGLLDLGYVAFYAVGAYAYAVLASNYGLSFWILLPLSGILAAFWGIILGFPVLRLRGDYLAIVTLAFGEIIHKVLINWKEFSHGNDGILNLPVPNLFGLEFKAGPGGFEDFFGLAQTPRILPLVHSKIFLFYVVLALVALIGLMTTRLRRLPVGRAWEALREDEVACRSLGIDTTKTKLAAFAIGALIGGIAGCCFAARQAYVNPESFVFMESVVVLAIVVLGGMGSLFGVAAAALVMIGGMELLRELSFMKIVFGADFDASQYRFLLFGLAMVVMMLWKPRGLISNRTPSAFLKERKTVSGDLVKEGHG